MSFYKLVEVLGIVGDTNNEENQGNSNAENSENQDAEQTDATLTLNDIEVSEATREFVADVESVAFSNPKLVSVSKAEEDTTVGAIKDGLNLECEYSAELTKEQIAEINAAEVQSGDWALISLKAFDTEESLTVTMKTGEVFEIRVTDAQIQKDFMASLETQMEEAKRAGDTEQLRTLESQWVEASAQRAEYADAALQARNLKERVEAMCSKERRRSVSADGSCRTAEDFFRMTRPEYRKGELKAYSDDETQRFVEKVVVGERTVTVVFKAGIEIEVER